MEEEISVVQVKKEGVQRSEATHIEQSMNDYFEQQQQQQDPNSVEIQAMKAALQSVHPFIPSIYNSEFYYLKPNTVQLGDQGFGIFACKLKSFSNRPIHDIQLYYALLYEIECKIVHRQSQQLIDTTFSVFDMNIKQAFSNYNILPNTLDTLEQKFTLHGTCTTSSLIKSIFNIYFSTQQQTGDSHEIVLCACLLPDQISFTKLGYYDIYFSIRGKLIVQTDLVVIPMFMLQLDKLLMINSLKISQYQLAQRFTYKNNILECIIAPLTVQLQHLQYLRPLGESLSPNYFKHKQTENIQSSTEQAGIEQKNTIQSTKQAENSSAFSYDDDGHEGMPTQSKSQMASPKKTYKFHEDFDELPGIEQLKQPKTSLLGRLFSGQHGNEEEISKLRIRSSKSKKEVQIKTTQQFHSTAHLAEVTPQQLKNDEVATIQLELSGGEFALFFQQNMESKAVSSNQGHNYGVQIEEKQIRLQTKNNAVAVKLLLSAGKVDVYANSRFLASYDYEDIFLKFFDKNSRAEVIQPQDV